MKLTKRSSLLPFLFFVGCSFALAGEGAGPDAKMRPIEVHSSTLFGLQYSLDDSPLLSYRDFEELIAPLRDQEATRLLRKSESSALSGSILRLLGFAGALTGAAGLLTGSSNEQTGFLLTAAGGGICINIGGLFQSESQSAKFNCVQRYNRFARGEEHVLPEAPADEKSLLDFGKPINAPVKNTKSGKKKAPAQ